MSTFPEPTVTSPASPRAARSREAIVREYQAIKAGAGYCRLDDRLIIRVSGDDRVSFLHGMCTADIKGMRPGQVAPALFVTERAHIIRDFYVYALADALLLESDRDAWPDVRAHLEKFLVADDVEMEEQEALAVIDCEGPASAASLRAAGMLTAPLAPWCCAPSDMPSNGPSELFAHIPRLGSPAFTILVERPAVATILTQLAAAGLTELGLEAREIVRVERGLARVGIDTNDKTLALEARCEPAISFNKGCYIGQETIERATARGGIKRRLCGLSVLGDRAPAVGASIMLADKPVGLLTSIAESPAYGLIGLAIMHHSAWTEGTVVTLTGTDSGITARVAELPFIDR
ncbi:MAG TPA: glycine cleavage T C-terminal barrel domain-containing protein [Candidatus Binataceae bacterium]|nr:glycine cleavage T C-terminal barrel domain-containing protein [Candidatus Binataceae bacterium]